MLLLKQKTASTAGTNANDYAKTHPAFVDFVLRNQAFLSCLAFALDLKSFDEFQESLMRLCAPHDVLKFVQLLMHDEFERKHEAEPGSILRGTSIVAKLSSQHARNTSTKYQKFLLLPWLKKLEPMAEFNVESAQDRDRICELASELADLITRHESVEMLPRDLRVMAREIASLCNEFDLADQRWPLVGGLLVLRLFCPTLVSPTTYGLLPPDTVLSVAFRKNVTLITRMLQNASNHQPFKDGALVGLNAWVERYAPRIDAFLDEVVRVAGPSDDSSSPLSVSGTNAGQATAGAAAGASSASVTLLVQLFVQNRPKVEAEIASRRLPPELTARFSECLNACGNPFKTRTGTVAKATESLNQTLNPSAAPSSSSAGITKPTPLRLPPDPFINEVAECCVDQPFMKDYFLFPSREKTLRLCLLLTHEKGVPSVIKQTKKDGQSHRVFTGRDAVDWLAANLKIIDREEQGLFMLQQMFEMELIVVWNERERPFSRKGPQTVEDNDRTYSFNEAAILELRRETLAKAAATAQMSAAAAAAAAAAASASASASVSASSSAPESHPSSFGNVSPSGGTSSSSRVSPPVMGSGSGSVSPSGGASARVSPPAIGSMGSGSVSPNMGGSLGAGSDRSSPPVGGIGALSSSSEGTMPTPTRSPRQRTVKDDSSWNSIQQQQQRSPRPLGGAKSPRRSYGDGPVPDGLGRMSEVEPDEDMARLQTIAMWEEGKRTMQPFCLKELGKIGLLETAREAGAQANDSISSREQWRTLLHIVWGMSNSGYGIIRGKDLATDTSAFFTEEQAEQWFRRYLLFETREQVRELLKHLSTDGFLVKEENFDGLELYKFPFSKIRAWYEKNAAKSPRVMAGTIQARSSASPSFDRGASSSSVSPAPVMERMGSSSSLISSPLFERRSSASALVVTGATSPGRTAPGTPPGSTSPGRSNSLGGGGDFTSLGNITPPPSSPPLPVMSAEPGSGTRSRVASSGSRDSQVLDRQLLDKKLTRASQDLANKGGRSNSGSGRSGSNSGPSTGAPTGPVVTVPGRTGSASGASGPVVPRSALSSTGTLGGSGAVPPVFPVRSNSGTLANAPVRFSREQHRTGSFEGSRGSITLSSSATLAKSPRMSGSGMDFNLEEDVSGEEDQQDGTVMDLLSTDQDDKTPTSPNEKSGRMNTLKRVFGKRDSRGAVSTTSGADSGRTSGTEKSSGSASPVSGKGLTSLWSRAKTDTGKGDPKDQSK